MEEKTDQIDVFLLRNVHQTIQISHLLSEEKLEKTKSECSIIELQTGFIEKQ